MSIEEQLCIQVSVSSDKLALKDSSIMHSSLVFRSVVPHRQSFCHLEAVYRDPSAFSPLVDNHHLLGWHHLPENQLVNQFLILPFWLGPNFVFSVCDIIKVLVECWQYWCQSTLTRINPNHLNYPILLVLTWFNWFYHTFLDLYPVKNCCDTSNLPVL